MKPLSAISLAATLLAVSSGCAVDNSGPDEVVGSVNQALVSGSQHVYLRCNATAWGADDSTRLKDWIAPGMRYLVYQVSEPWMVSGSDSCELTVTDQLNGWGSSQTAYVPSGTSTISPSQAEQVVAAQPGQSTHFQVDYPALGKYRALFGAGFDPTVISIESESAICAAQFCPSSTHCELAPAGIPTCVYSGGN